MFYFLYKMTRPFLVLNLFAFGLSICVSSQFASAFGGQSIDKVRYLKLLKEGERELKAKQIDQAIRKFSKAIRVLPKDYRAYYQRGVCYRKNGQKKEAIEDYQQAIKLNANFAKAYNNLAAIYSDQQEHQKAVKLLKQAVLRQSDYAEAWFNMGLAFSALNKHSEAAKAYKRALRLRPKDVDVRINLGGSLQRLNELKGALVHLGYAVKLKPNDALARRGYGELLLISGEYPKAVIELEKAVTLDSKSLRGWKKLALAYLNVNKKRDARRALNRGLIANPRSADLYLALGRLERRLKDFPKARRALKEALALKNDDKRPHFILGLIAVDEGKCKKAKKSFEIYLKARREQAKLPLLMKRCKKQ